MKTAVFALVRSVRRRTLRLVDFGVANGKKPQGHKPTLRYNFYTRSCHTGSEGRRYGKLSHYPRQ